MKIMLAFCDGKNSGPVSFRQDYYTMEDDTLIGPNQHMFFVADGVMHYAEYTGRGTYSEEGITDLTKGIDKTAIESKYEAGGLFDLAQKTMSEVDKLLNDYMNLRLRNIGFPKL